MQDGRKAILISAEMAQWIGPRGYVEDVGHAIALAVLNPKAAGKTYNIAIERAMTELEWAEEVAKAFGWEGEIVTLRQDRMPQHLVQPGNAAQHWTASSARIRQELGYQEIVPWEESLKRTIQWELANPPAQVDPKQFDYEAEDAALERRG
jgi:nucleoside-diphosphate-sugar epimerase